MAKRKFKLNKCPQCGARNIEIRKGSHGFYGVCYSCDFTDITENLNEQQAVDNWNSLSEKGME